MSNKDFEKYLKKIEKMTLNDFASKSMSIQEEIHDNYVLNYVSEYKRDIKKSE